MNIEEIRSRWSADPPLFVEILCDELARRNAELAAKQQYVDTLSTELAAAKRQIEADRTAIIDGVNALKREINSRMWIANGRGPYEWNDDRYRQEFTDAADAIMEALKPLEKIGTDLSGCPQTGVEVIKARMALDAELLNVKAENARLVAKLVKAQSLVSQTREALNLANGDD